MIRELSTLQCRDEPLTVLLDNIAGGWKIVEGYHHIDVIKHLMPPEAVTPTPRKYRVITIFLNNTCNLRCDYCRFDQVTHHDIEYGKRDLQAVVDAVLSLSEPNERLEIHFQGGEPLLRHTDIAWICEALSAQNVSIDPRFFVTTNGTVCTDRILDLLQQHRIGVTVSIDGLPEVHDAKRKMVNGDGSFDRAEQTLRTFQRNGIPVGVFCVVSDVTRMLDIYDHFVGAMGLDSFLMAPLEIDGTHDARDIHQYLALFFANQIKIIERNLDTFRETGHRIRESLTELLLLGKVVPHLYSKACGNSPHSNCGKQMHSIERNGDVLPCQNSRMNAGKGTEYLNNGIKRFGICESCEIRAHCSTPICFTRIDHKFVDNFLNGDPDATTYITGICDLLKSREMALFQLMFHRKSDILNYLRG
jgi:sulfatase maturation enzyme AslB (radical SAM superfamily)